MFSVFTTKELEGWHDFPRFLWPLGDRAEDEKRILWSKLNGLSTEYAPTYSPAIPRVSNNGKNRIHPALSLSPKLYNWIQVLWLLLLICSWCCCWTSASAQCDDKRPRERETGGTHHSIVRHWKPARALLKSLAIFHLFSGCQSYCFQQQFLILGYFRESFTANRNLCPELGFFEL